MLRVKKWVAAELSVAMLTAALIESTQAGPTNGRQVAVHRMDARSKDVFHLTFRGGESAAVVIDGDGDTDLDLYVYYENGNLIGSNTDNSDT